MTGVLGYLRSDAGAYRDVALCTRPRPLDSSATQCVGGAGGGASAGATSAAGVSWVQGGSAGLFWCLAEQLAFLLVAQALWAWSPL